MSSSAGITNDLPCTALLHWKSTTRVPEGASVSDQAVMPQLQLRIGTHLLKRADTARQANVGQPAGGEPQRTGAHHPTSVGYRETEEPAY